VHLQQTSSGELRFLVYFCTYKLSIFEKFNIFVLFAQIASHIFVQSKRVWPRIDIQRHAALLLFILLWIIFIKNFIFGTFLHNLFSDLSVL